MHPKKNLKPVGQPRNTGNYKLLKKIFVSFFDLQIEQLSKHPLSYEKNL